jgi:hypothetical protein
MTNMMERVFWSCYNYHIGIVKYLVKEVKEIDVNKVNNKWVRFTIKIVFHLIYCITLSILTMMSETNILIFE